MANSRSEFLKKRYYNIYNCWFDNQNIFIEDEDFDKFYSVIVKYLWIEKNVQLISYCFLKDHFHLILYSIKTGYAISDFMRKVLLSYSIYFKNKYKDSYKNSLFEWRFKAQLINSMEYLHQSVAYINFNALYHNLVDDIVHYKYTSYHRLKNEGNKDFEKYKWVILDELEFWSD